MLKFLGTGGAFNVKRGNNSAYLFLGSELIVLDCGEDTFKKLVVNNLFDKVTRVNFFITHLHGDHVGSLGTTITYLYFKIFNKDKSKINVFYPETTIVEYLALQGTVEKFYTFYINTWDEIYVDGCKKMLEYNFEKTDHVEELQSAYSIIIEMKKEFVTYYSGDTNVFCDKLKNIWNYDYVYHEVTMIKDSKVHFPYDKLLEVTKDFKVEDKKKIWLMHLDDDFEKEKALKDGFQVVENEFE